ncbi:hypothetical protein [Massilia sp. KIM]|uniref:hypothetical protein n=1 Tax=Massilia sp. KIM TaxID=1955422 RepID=UPI00117D0E6B|nr:hypothetical protein [Massilia sp. KIM]
MDAVKEDVGSGKLILSLSLLLLGVAGGWLLTSKMAGTGAGYSALLVCGILAALTFGIQLAVHFTINNRLWLAPLFYAVFGLDLAWFLLSLFLPIYWVEGLPVSVKVLVTCILGWLCAANFGRGYKAFSKRWSECHDPARIGKVNAQRRTIEWWRVQKILRHHTHLYIPGVPHRAISFIAVVSVFSMLIGLNLRIPYPVFSAFAWGIPCAIFGAFFFQLIGNRIAEAKAIDDLQKQLGIIFTCAP